MPIASNTLQNHQFKHYEMPAENLTMWYRIVCQTFLGITMKAHGCTAHHGVRTDRWLSGGTRGVERSAPFLSPGGPRHRWPRPGRGGECSVQHGNRTAAWMTAGVKAQGWTCAKLSCWQIRRIQIFISAWPFVKTPNFSENARKWKRYSIQNMCSNIWHYSLDSLCAKYMAICGITCFSAKIWDLSRIQGIARDYVEHLFLGARVKKTHA